MGCFISWNRTNPNSNIVLRINYIGVEGVQEETQKIIIPKELQKEMMKFFLETSIPRIKQEKLEKQRLLSESKTDGSKEE